ncbi:MAG: AI-2E family transporter, partial [Planctomycetes bacterium]|nr:AI-2E family transporter [Planctomycetota bacterium]
MEREDARRRTLYLTAVGLVVLYLAYLARQAVVPLLVALLLAYLLAPLVAVLERRGFSRMGAVTTLFVLFFGTTGLALVFGLPPLLVEGRALVRATIGEPGLTLDPVLPPVMKGLPDRRPPATLKEFLEARQRALGDVPRDPDVEPAGYWERKERSLRLAGREQALLEFRGSHEDWRVCRRDGRIVAFNDFNRDGHFDAGYVFDGALLGGAWVRERLRNPALATALEDMATDALPTLAESLFLHGSAVARGALGILGTALTVLGWLIIVPLYTFFFLMRLEDVWAAFVEYLPGTHRDRVLKVLGDVHRMLIGFFRGRITTMFLKGVIVAGGLAFLGVPFWPVFGALAGLLTIVPAVGPILAGAPAVILSYSEDGVVSAGLVVGLLVAAEIVEGYILIPKMIGKEVGLHPMAVITSVLIGAALLGVFGVVIAIPLAAAAKIVWTEFVLP